MPVVGTVNSKLNAVYVFNGTMDPERNGVLTVNDAKRWKTPFLKKCYTKSSCKTKCNF